MGVLELFKNIMCLNENDITLLISLGVFQWDQVSGEHNSPLIPRLHGYKEHSTLVLLYNGRSLGQTTVNHHGD